MRRGLAAAVKNCQVQGIETVQRVLQKGGGAKRRINPAQQMS